MSETHVSMEGNHGPGNYEIRLKGHLDHRWTDRFEGMMFTHESDGTTILSGPVVDQAALHGLLRKVRDLGLTLISIIQVDPQQTNDSDVNTETKHNHSKKEANT